MLCSGLIQFYYYLASLSYHPARVNEKNYQAINRQFQSAKQYKDLTRKAYPKVLMKLSPNSKKYIVLTASVLTGSLYPCKR